MAAVGQNSNLGTGIRARITAALLQRHGQQSNGHLLPGRDQHVHFPGRGFFHDVVGQTNKTVGFPTHGRYHNHHVMTFLAEAAYLFCNRFNPFCGAHRSATEFLNQERHFFPDTKRGQTAGQRPTSDDQMGEIIYTCPFWIQLSMQYFSQPRQEHLPGHPPVLMGRFRHPGPYLDDRHLYRQPEPPDASSNLRP